MTFDFDSFYNGLATGKPKTTAPGEFDFDAFDKNLRDKQGLGDLPGGVQPLPLDPDAGLDQDDALTGANLLAEGPTTAFERPVPDFHMAPSTAREDMPSSRSYSEAYGQHLDRGHDFGGVPSPLVQPQIVQHAGVTALEVLTQAGLTDGTLPVDNLDPTLLKDLTEAYTYLYTGLYSPASKAQALQVGSTSVKRLGELLIPSLERELLAAEANPQVDPSADPFDNRANSFDDPNPTGNTKAQIELMRQDLEALKVIAADAENPNTSKALLHYIREQKDTFGKGVRGRDPKTLGTVLPQRVLDGMFFTFNGDMQVAHDENPLFADFANIMDRRLKGRTGEGSAIADPQEFLSDTLFRGALTEVKSNMFGISPEAAAELTPMGMLALTHPRKANRVLREKERLSVPQHFVDDEVNTKNRQALADILGPSLERSPEIIDLFLNMAENEYDTLERLIDPSDKRGMDAARASFEEMGADLEAGPILGVALPALGAILSPFNDAWDAYFDRRPASLGRVQRENIQALAAAASGTLEVIKKVQGVQKSIDEAASISSQAITFSNRGTDVTRDSPSHPLWMQGMDKLGSTLQAVGVNKGWGTWEIKDRVMSPDGDLETAINHLAWQDEATEAIRSLEGRVPIEVIRSRVQDMKDAAVKKDNSFTIEDVKAAGQRIARAQQEGDNLEVLGGVFDQTVSTLGMLWDGIFDQVATEPGTMTREFVVGTALVPAGVLTVGGAKALGQATVGRVASARRLRKGMDVYNQFDANVVPDIRRVADKIGATASTKRAQRWVESLNDALGDFEEISQVKLNKEGKMSQALDSDYTLKSRKLTKVLSQVDPRHFDDVLNVFDFDNRVQRWIQDPSLFGSVIDSAFGDLALKRIDIGGKARKIKQGADLRAQRAVNALLLTAREGRKIDLSALHVAPEQLRDGDGRRWNDLLGRPGHDTAERYNLIAEYAVNHEADVLKFRAWQGERKSNAVDFLQQLQRKQIREMKEIGYETPGALSSDLSAVQLQRDRLSRLSTLERELLHKTPDNGFTLADSDIADMATLEDVMAFGAKHSREGLYNAGRVRFETSDRFFKRVNKLMKKADSDDPGDAPKKIDTLKRKLIKNLTETQGMKGDFIIDEIEGFVSPRRARQLRKEAGKFEETLERVSEELGELDPGIKKEAKRIKALQAKQKKLEDFADEQLSKADFEGLSDEFFEARQGLSSIEGRVEVWDNVYRTINATLKALPMKERGTSATTRILGNMLEAFSNLGDHRFMGKYNAAQSMGRSLKEALIYWTERVSNMEKRLGHLSPDDRKVFDHALLAQRDFGVDLPLKELRQREAFKEIFKDYPETADEAIQNLLDDSKDFRLDILNEARSAGVLTRDEFISLAGPYSARLFGAFEWPKQLKGKNGKRLTDEGSVNAQVAHEFEQQRHVSKVTVGEGMEGGRVTTRTFADHDQASEFVRQKYGDIELKKEDTFSGGEDFSGTTKNGTRVSIASPLPEGFSKKFNELQPGVAQFQRLRSLMLNLQQRQFIETLDLPGMAISKTELGGLSPLRQGGYTQVVGSRWGSLNGKYMHNNALRVVNEYTEGMDIRTTMHDALEAFSQHYGGIASILGVAGKMWTGTAAAAHSAISTFQIALNPATNFLNVLSDNLFFGRAAAGEGFLTSGKAWRARGDAWQALTDLEEGKIRFKDLDPDVQVAIRQGVVDETIIGRSSSNEMISRLMLSEGKTTGKQKWLDMQKSTYLGFRDDPEFGPLLDRSEALDDILAVDDLTPKQRNALVREKASLDNHLRKGVGPWSKSVGQGMQGFNALLGRSTGAAGDVKLVSGDFYRKSGNMTRLAAYLYQVRKGVNPVEAAERVNMFMQTYSQVPTGLKALSKSVVGNPIVSFPYELARTTKNIAMHEPGFLAGYSSAGPALNTLSMAAGGIDPTAARREYEMNSKSPMGWLGAMTHQVKVNLGNGHIITIDMPGLGMHDNWLAGGGYLGNLGGNMEDQANLTGSGIDKAISFAGRAASNFVGNSPMLNVVQSVATGKDAFTQRSTTTMEAAGKFAQTFVPPWAYGVGRFHGQMMDTLESAPHAYTNRQRSMFETGLRQLTGIKITAGAGGTIVPEALAGSVAGATSLWSMLLGVSPDKIPDSPDKILGDKGGLTEVDQLAMIMIATGKFDKQRGERRDDRNFRDMRAGYHMARSEDPDEAARGQEIFDEASKKFEERERALRALDILPIKGKGNEDAILDATARIVKMSDPWAMYEDFPTTRKTLVLGAVLTSRLGKNPDLVSRLERSFYLSEGFNWKSPDLDSIEESIHIMDQLKLDLVPEDPRVDIMNQLTGFLESRKADALFRRAKKIKTTETYGAAEDFLNQRKK